MSSQTSAKFKHVHFQTPEQEQYLNKLHRRLSELILLPLSDSIQRTQHALNILDAAIKGPEGLGWMTQSYVRELFSYGEQALRVLEATITYHLARNRKVDLSRFKYSKEGRLMAPDSKNTIFSSEQRIRSHCLHHQLGDMDVMDYDDAARLGQGEKVLSLCAGETFIMAIRGVVHQISELEGPGREYMSEMHDCAMMALIGMARCLSARYMLWPVEIRGQVLPGTGQEPPETLKDWAMLVP